MLDFVKGFSFTYWDNLVIFVFNPIYVVKYIYWLIGVEPPSRLWNKTNVIIMDDLFDICLYLIFKYFIKYYPIHAYEHVHESMHVYVWTREYILIF